MQQPDQCASCGRTFEYGRVLFGFTPCQCGGHAYAWCRDDDGREGCGHTTYSPPVDDETCRRVSFGYEGRPALTNRAGNGQPDTPDSIPDRLTVAVGNEGETRAWAVRPAPARVVIGARLAASLRSLVSSSRSSQSSPRCI
jgi:hypothetical protein